MFVTTLTAAWQLTLFFRAKASAAVLSADAFTFNLDAILVSCMGMLAVVVLVDMLFKWYNWASGRREITTSEVTEYSAS
jgi:flagellar biosynthesis protein FlhB